MDGVHDTGGRQGFGPVRPRPSGEARPAPFGARWEARVFACVMGLGGVAVRSSDQFRHAVERVRPEAYLTHGYYGRWLGGLETLVLEAGLLERAAIDARALALGAAPDAVVAAQPEVQPARPPVRLPPLQQPRDPQALPARAHALRPLAAPPAFAPGDRVRTRAHGADGHTRLPAYARGRVGTVVAWHDGWVYPDTNAHLLGEHPQHLYTVAFPGTELWGEDAEPGMQVMLDLFEPYLSAAAPPRPHEPHEG
jgi:nitrile hydratase